MGWHQKNFAAHTGCDAGLGGEEKVAEFRAQFPFFINWFIDWTWEPDYRNRQKALLDSLGVDVLDDPLVEMKEKKDKGWWRWFF